MTSKESHCLLFPGQGAHDLNMLKGVTSCKQFNYCYNIICEIIKSNPLKEIERGNKEYISQNLISSVLTVLISSLSLDLYLRSQSLTPSFLAGYSVGQWTAMYAAKMISFEQLIEVLKVRAELMDDCIARQKSGMLAVIGVPQQLLEDFCHRFQREGYFIAISNYNCPGQFTLSGTEKAINMAIACLDQLHPKKYLRVPVSGAWHCLLLEKAAEAFQKHLQPLHFNCAQIPIVDNVTGDFLPKDEVKLKNQLVAHICSPVQWASGIKNLVQKGCKKFIEIGYGNMLTKFGYFIDRSVTHEFFYNTHKKS